MHILITGGTGFIGAHYVCRYPQHAFTLLTRNPQRARKQFRDSAIAPNNIHFIGSLSELPNLNNVDAIINLAGEAIAEKRWNAKQKAAICDSRWRLTQQLVDLIKQADAPPKTFISGSAIGYYGDAGAQKLTENSSPANTDFAQTLCQRWEEIALGAKAHCRVVIIRTGIVLGAQAGALEKMLLPFKLGLGATIAHGNQIMSWIHQRDAIRAIEFLLHNETAVGAFNLTAPTPVSNRVFTHTLAATLRRKALLSIPAALLKILMDESAALLLASQNIYPEKLLSKGFTFDFTELPMALAHIVNTK